MPEIPGFPLAREWRKKGLKWVDMDFSHGLEKGPSSGPGTKRQILTSSLSSRAGRDSCSGARAAVHAGRRANRVGTPPAVTQAQPRTNAEDHPHSVIRSRLLGHNIEPHRMSFYTITQRASQSNRNSDALRGRLPEQQC